MEIWYVFTNFLSSKLHTNIFLNIFYSYTGKYPQIISENEPNSHSKLVLFLTPNYMPPPLGKCAYAWPLNLVLNLGSKRFLFLGNDAGLLWEWTKERECFWKKYM